MAIVRNLKDGPLCPNSTTNPSNAAHQLRVRILDAFYDAVPKNEVLEMPEPAALAYHAAEYGSDTSDRMSLYVERASFTFGCIPVTVESWFFKCSICGLILSAGRVSNYGDR